MKVISSFAMLLFASLLILSPKAEASSIDVYVDGDRLEFTNSAHITEGRTMVELRPIFESLGVMVDWEQSTQTITTAGDTKMEMQINSQMATVNGSMHQLDVPPTIYEGRTVVPLRFVVEAAGVSVQWDQVNQRVIIGEEHGIETSLWEGYYTIDDHPDLRGGLVITDENDKYFSFEADVAYTHVGQIEGVAEKQGPHTASLVYDPYGCEMTLTRDNGRVTLSEDNLECSYYSGVAIDLNRSYVK
ncbi:copper amine oxidase-like protein [Salsuginibacillus halophilus]|uniref:Copper amine oxidase-like protein n=1 Tax=Salsuginibacillus halophilus TaxID=517424 RepID=A0A2P8H3L7_9BACI|nr:copper amine oxidase N-terminal domain-containing protein [Salsuginibacillus halophilus]PSL40812.1 copper amine oxidase-like protein [Salsuginibacillus halophilus]